MTVGPLSNLNELIAAAQDDVGPDPHDIAARVEPLIPETERHAVFLALLARYIVDTKPRLTQVLGPVRSPTAPPAARSAKVAAYREHARFLRLNVNVGPGERKWMEDCTYADLMFAAHNRRQKAAETVAAAEQYEELAALLKQHRATTVGRLPRRVLDAFLDGGRAAA